MERLMLKNEYFTSKYICAHLLRKRFLLVVMATLVSYTSFSQAINIENRKLEDGTYGFSGALDMSFSVQKQVDPLISLRFRPIVQYKFNGKKENERLLAQKLAELKIKHEDSLKAKDSTHLHLNDSVTVKEDSTKRKKIMQNLDRNRHLILLINDLNYTATKGNTFNNSGLSHLRYAYSIGHSDWKWESYTQIQYNKLLLQKMRYLLGSGFRIKIFDIKANKDGYKDRAIRASAGSSLFYEYEDINYSTRPEEFRNTLRWSSYLSTYFNFKFFEFTSSFYLEPNLIAFKDYKTSGDYSLLFRVTDPFSIKFNFSHYHDTRAPESTPATTYAFTAGFVYKLDKFKVDPEEIREKKQKTLSKWKKQKAEENKTEINVQE